MEESQTIRDELLKFRSEHDTTITTLTTQYNMERDHWNQERNDVDNKWKGEIEQIIKAITEERQR